MGQGRFNFGSFLTCQGDQNASKEALTTLVLEGVSQTHDEATLRAKLDNSRGCVCTERYMDMIAARFRTNAQAGRAYNGLIHLGCGNPGELRSVSVTGYSSCGWMEEKTVAGSDLQT